MANTESSGFLYYLNLLKMRFISWVPWGFTGEWLLGQGRSWGTEAGDLLGEVLGAVPGLLLLLALGRR